MGKRGGGRKGFVKFSRGSEEDHSAVINPEPALAAEKFEAPAETALPDDSAKFLKDTEPAVAKRLTATAKNGTSESAEDERAALEQTAPLPEALQGETKGQLSQRHKRELKAHKEHTKKLGKKRKDEVEELDRAIEALHKAELEAWEVANRDGDSLEDATIVAPTASLYELTIGTQEKAAKKLTKAQKRREQRAAEEVEREARIAQEQVGMGTSEREREAESLHHLLQPLGLAVHDIPADGHCMYRAVQHQLAANGVEEAPDHMQLREETASYMRAFPAEFEPFVLREEGGGGDQFERYCRDVEETAAWGGQLELQALAQALERHVVVHAVGLPVVEMGAEHKGKGTSLHVCYLRHAYGLGEHYNSVTTAEPSAQGMHVMS